MAAGSISSHIFLHTIAGGKYKKSSPAFSRIVFCFRFCVSLFGKK